MRPRNRRVLVIGTGPIARATVLHLSSQRRVVLLGALALGGEAVHPLLGTPVVGGVHTLLDYLLHHAVDEVYLAGNLVEHFEALQEAVATCEHLGTSFAIPAQHFRLHRSMPVLRGLGDDGYIHYQCDRAHPVQEVIKRGIDILASGTALALLSPLLIAAAIAIRLDSRGPVLFPQLRVGLHGRMFRMLKFRSMMVDAEANQRALLETNEQTGPVFKMRADPRITRVGRFLRRYSIDELPQLVNVLRGDMSLVGPRPPLLKEVEQYEPWQRRRLSVRPGLTCIWQVSGRNAIGFQEWMHLDLQYVATRSLATDLRLIARTIPVVVTGSGAS